MTHDFLLYAGLVVASLASLVVLAACVCRIDQMRSSRHRWGWFLLYLLFAVYALGTLCGIWRHRAFSWDDAAGLGGMLLYMVLTRRLWVNGAPPETVKGELL